MAAGDYHPLDMWDDFDDDRGSEPVTLRFTSCLGESLKAWLLEIGGTKVWIPKSQASLDEKARKVTIPEWLRVAKGLVYR